jgi:hypothetical protein
MDDLAVMTEIDAEHLLICEQMVDAQKRHIARLNTIGADVQNDMRLLLRYEAMMTTSRDRYRELRQQCRGRG